VFGHSFISHLAFLGLIFFPAPVLNFLSRTIFYSFFSGAAVKSRFSIIESLFVVSPVITMTGSIKIHRHRRFHNYSLFIIHFSKNILDILTSKTTKSKLYPLHPKPYPINPVILPALS
jgi:hypothetical protein